MVNLVPRAQPVYAEPFSVVEKGVRDLAARTEKLRETYPQGDFVIVHNSNSLYVYRAQDVIPNGHSSRRKSSGGV